MENGKRKMENEGKVRGFRRFAPLKVFLAAALFAAQCALAAVPLLDTYYSPKNSERPVRTSTRFIILHTTEGAARGSGSKLQKNGEANYMVDEAGRIYRIIDRKRVAYHCGRSMWNGLASLDNYSVGIEVVGFHNKDPNAAQCKALKALLAELKKTYKISDDRVLTHSMVAYGAPNQWHKRSHRGRKRCAMRMALPSVRRKLGLNSKPSYDPDVKAGRLVVADKALQQVLYSVDKKGGNKKPAPQITATPEKPKQTKKPAQQKQPQQPAPSKTTPSRPASSTPQPSPTTLEIGVGQTAWDVVRGAYKAHDTLYTFPNGEQKRGDEITNWKTVPSGTKVALGVADEKPAQKKPAPAPAQGATAPAVAARPVVATQPPPASADEALDEADAVRAYDAQEAAGGNIVGKGKSAWDIARDAYAAETTIYEFPNGDRKKGSEITKWNAIPPGTRVIVAEGDANEPEQITSIGAAAAAARAAGTAATSRPVDAAPQPTPPAQVAGPEAPPIVASALAAIAGAEWNSERTIYVTEKGLCIKGSELDADRLAQLTPDTKVFTGYKVGGPITATNPAYKICGPVWRDEGTQFLFPGGKMESGDKVDAKKIPPNTMILYKD